MGHRDLYNVCQCLSGSFWYLHATQELKQHFSKHGPGGGGGHLYSKVDIMLEYGP